MIETLSLKNDETLEDEGNIIYTLSANKYYSVYFEIQTAARSVDIHQDIFSKEIEMSGEKHSIVYLTCIVTISRNCLFC